jgi:parallel beta-helix repeat protein/predicted outer membrane repeat protein
LAGNDVDVDDPFNLLGGPGRTENSLNVIVGFYVGPDALLDGIVITGGYSDMHTDRGGPVAGAGLFNYSSSPTIINCTFTGNATAEVGGGMLNRNGSNAKVRNCTFSRNYAHYGGGAANWQSHPEFTRCVFLMNGAGFNGGGMDNQQGSSPKLLDCTFSHNRAKSSGGGLCSDIGSPILIDCILADNWAGWQGGAVSCAGLESTGCTFTANRAEDAGGAVRASGKLILSNCIIMRNDAVRLGGGIYIMYEDRSSLTNCTFAGNSAVNGRAFACDSQGQQYPSDISAVNCILWDGGDEISNRDGSRIEIAYSDIQFGQDGVHDPCSGVLWGPGNIRSEPLFSDIDRKDVHLKSQAGRWDPNRRSWIKDDVTSPCIDAGNMAWSIGTEPFPNGGRINLGAYGGTSEASKSYFGKPVCETVVAGDINGDCRVDSGDLAILANHWLEER